MDNALFAANPLLVVQETETELPEVQETNGLEVVMVSGAGGSVPPPPSFGSILVTQLPFKHVLNVPLLSVSQTSPFLKSVIQQPKLIP